MSDKNKMDLDKELENNDNVSFSGNKTPRKLTKISSDTGQPEGVQAVSEISKLILKPHKQPNITLSDIQEIVDNIQLVTDDKASDGSLSPETKELIRRYEGAAGKVGSPSQQSLEGNSSPARSPFSDTPLSPTTLELIKKYPIEVVYSPSQQSLEDNLSSVFNEQPFSKEHFDIINKLTLDSYNNILRDMPEKVAAQLKPVQDYLEHRERCDTQNEQFNETIMKKSIASLKKFKNDINVYTWNKIDNSYFDKRRIDKQLEGEVTPVNWDESQKVKLDQLLEKIDWDALKNTCGYGSKDELTDLRDYITTFGDEYKRDFAEMQIRVRDFLHYQELDDKEGQRRCLYYLAHAVREKKLTSGDLTGPQFLHRALVESLPEDLRDSYKLGETMDLKKLFTQIEPEKEIGPDLSDVPLVTSEDIFGRSDTPLSEPPEEILKEILKEILADRPQSSAELPITEQGYMIKQVSEDQFELQPSEDQSGSLSHDMINKFYREKLKAKLMVDTLRGLKGLISDTGVPKEHKQLLWQGYKQVFWQAHKGLIENPLVPEEHKHVLRQANAALCTSQENYKQELRQVYKKLMENSFVPEQNKQQLKLVDDTLDHSLENYKYLLGQAYEGLIANPLVPEQDKHQLKLDNDALDNLQEDYEHLLEQADNALRYLQDNYEQVLRQAGNTLHSSQANDTIYWYQLERVIDCWCLQDTSTNEAYISSRISNNRHNIERDTIHGLTRKGDLRHKRQDFVYSEEFEANFIRGFDEQDKNVKKDIKKIHVAIEYDPQNAKNLKIQIIIKDDNSIYITDNATQLSKKQGHSHPHYITKKVSEKKWLSYNININRDSND